MKKNRAFAYALVVGLASLNSGCYVLHNCFPNLGWRFHCPPTCGPACPPACGPCGPVGYRPPVVVPGGPDCVGCNGGQVPHQPAGYQPMIGNPIPIPGSTIIPGGELHPPTPTDKDKKGGN